MVTELDAIQQGVMGLTFYSVGLRASLHLERRLGGVEPRSMITVSITSYKNL